MKVDLPDESSESESSRNGFMSYSGEVHAAINGFFKGVFGRAARAERPDSQKEVHYFRGFYMLGRSVQLAAAFLGGSVAM